MKFSRDTLYVAVIIILIGICGQFYYSYQYLPKQSIRAYYSQDIEANKEIISVIQNADKFVYFAIYTFTREDIKNALLGAKHRGLDVRGLTDREQTDKLESQGKIISELRSAGIPLATQDHSGLMHIKTVVTEKEYATGSYNWTTNATKTNDEVLEIGRDELVRKQYENIIEKVLNKYK